MTGGQRDELVAARADAILAGVHAVEAYAEHFEAQMGAGTFGARMRRKARMRLASLRIFRRTGAILLPLILVPCVLVGYAAYTGLAPVTFSAANELTAVNTASGRLVTVTPLPAPPGAVSAADGSVWVAGPASVWVAGQGAGTISRIDPRTDQVTASVSLIGAPTELAIAGRNVWTGTRRIAVTTASHGLITSRV